MTKNIHIGCKVARLRKIVGLSKSSTIFAADYVKRNAKNILTLRLAKNNRKGGESNCFGR